jgi:hypothetical protein
MTIWAVIAEHDSTLGAAAIVDQHGHPERKIFLYLY